MVKTILTQDSTATPKQAWGVVPPEVMPIQAAIPDVDLGSLVLLADVITALGTLQTKYNTLLAELRLAGLITP